MLIPGSALTWLLRPDLQPLLGHGLLAFLAVVMGCVFAETGLLVGVFLPGDSLLFSAGLVAALAGRPNVVLLIVGCFAAAVAGDQVGYGFGAWVGPSIFTRPRSRLFKPENVVRSQDFFRRHGPKALVLARFVPIVRTFTPILAGVGRMPYRSFVVYNVVGAAVWACLATLLGYTLGKRFPGIERALTPVLIGVVALSLVPVLIEVRRSRAKA